MEFIEFNSVVKNGVIEIPLQFRGLLAESVRVIVRNQEGPQRTNLITTLLEHPLKAAGFRPLSREEAHARI